MTGRRRKDHHLPLRVYVIRGAHVYVDKTGKQHRLGKEWDAAAKARWIELSTGQAADDTARCAGVQYDGEWREGCEDCLRRTSPGDPDRQVWMGAPVMVVFECEYRIGPRDVPERLS